MYHDVSETIDENIILPMAKIMRDNNFSLIEPLKFLLKSEHFFDSSFFNSMIKSPLEFVFGVTKEFDLFNGHLRNYHEENSNNGIYNPPNKFINELSKSFYFFSQFDWRTRNMGLEIASPPSVSGWPAYYQAPVYDLFWINSMTIKNKKTLIIH